ncbi:MAG TPA: NAD(P)-dependent alcohol dehydrogenase [Streptosporangiaceae bacterium]|nr:NAD(P)-dependent alcohol dehydrogenase [Streptosporangiaceae bacterium]
MRAAQYDAYGPPEVLRIRTVPVPQLRPGHVLVKVAASSVNGADTAARAGKLKLVTGRSFPRGAGFDFAGQVTEAASDVTGLAAGDEVWGFADATRNPGPSGAAAEYVLAPAKRTALRPRSVSAVEAAALSGTGASAIGVLRDAVRLRSGERVLVRGANGGVGTAAVQVARALGGRVTALASVPHLDRLRDLGAEQAFDYHSADPRDLGRFDVIVDPVGKNMRPYRRLLAPGGRMAAMAIGSPGDIAYLLASAVHGSRRVRFVQAPPTAELLTALTGYVDGKSVTPVIDSVYPLDDIAAAHRSLEKSGGFGKRVIQVA